MHISHVAKAGGVEDSEADHPHPQWLQDSNANTRLSQQLGTYGRAKRKVEEMQKIIAESRRAH